MTHLWQRIGAVVYELHIESVGGTLYRVRYGTEEAYFDCEGDDIEVMTAAFDCVEGRVRER